ncbi:MAG: FAD-dependent oxidoreductase [Usitatibacter sp.]
MRVAIVGAGLAGMASAYFLRSSHQVTLFERAPELGGHASTVTVMCAGEPVAVDLGFHYFFKDTYPCFLALLRILGVEPRWVPGRFTIVDARGRSLVLPPRSLRQLADVLRDPRRLRWLLCYERLCRESGAIVAAEDWSSTLEELLQARGYPAAFGPELLYPFVAASWGAKLADVRHLPAYDVCKVMLHPARKMGFYEFSGGSATYVRALAQALSGVRIELGVGVARLTRAGEGYRIDDDQGHVHAFDAVVLATESFTAAALLADLPEARERHDLLALFRHFEAEIVVHGDVSVMPHRREDWSAVVQHHHATAAWMTDWPGARQNVPVFRSWLPQGQPEPRDVYVRRTFRHLLVGKDNRDLQRRLAALQGRDRLWTVGMYNVDVDNHESALTSAVVMARALAPDSPTLRRLEDEASESPASLRPRWTNWVGNQQARPARIFVPRTREELVEIVHLARAQSKKIRVCGASHTFSALVPTDDFLVDVREMRRISVDAPRRRVRMESGASVAEVDAALQAEGLVIPTNVVLSSVRYGGLVATGCHGSGRHQPTLSDFVEEMEVVDGHGRIRTLSDATIGPEAMDAARLGFGLFGIIHSITMRAEPMFNVHHVDRTRADMEATLRDLKQIVTTHDYCDLYWFPFSPAVLVKTYHRTDRPVTVSPRRARAERLFQLSNMRASQSICGWLTRHPRYTPATCRRLARLIPPRDVVEPVLGGIHFQNAIELMYARNMEIAFELDENFDNVRRAWRIAVDLVDRYARSGRWPLNLALNARFLGSSRALLSPCHGRKHTCFMEIMSFKNTPGWDEFVAELGAAWLALPGAAPHWPKEFEQIPGVFESIAARYGPNLRRFAEIRRELDVDPDDLFVNHLTRQILDLGESASQSVAASNA